MSTDASQSTTLSDGGQQAFSSEPSATDLYSKDKLVSFVEAERFSRNFTMPAKDGEESPFTVTYSDFGYRNETSPEEERVLLYCSPLLGSRLLHIAKDALAKRHRVRIICPDRPGIGGTTNVDVTERVQAWLKIVPALLEHLKIKRVSIVSHSGGAIYALNTMLYLRHLLHPTNPYVALCAPWVHPSHSGTPMGRFLCTLPVALLKQFDTAAGFMIKRIQPMLGFSFGLSQGLRKNHIATSAESTAVEFEERLIPHLVSKIYSESARGLTLDARLLLKTSLPDDVWGPWKDVNLFVPLLAEEEQNYRAGLGGVDLVQPLKIEVFYGESDLMIGTSAGPQWFDHCWSEERRGNYIEYSSSVIAGTDHENMLNLESGLFEKIFSQLPEHGI